MGALVVDQIRRVTRSTSARMTRRIWSSTSAPIARSVCLSPSSSSWKWRGMLLILPEAAGDVIFGALITGTREQPPGGAELHQLTEEEEPRPVGDAGGLL